MFSIAYLCRVMTECWTTPWKTWASRNSSYNFPNAQTLSWEKQGSWPCFINKTDSWVQESMSRGMFSFKNHSISLGACSHLSEAWIFFLILVYCIVRSTLGIFSYWMVFLKNSIQFIAESLEMCISCYGMFLTHRHVPDWLHLLCYVASCQFFLIS